MASLSAEEKITTLLTILTGMPEIPSDQLSSVAKNLGVEKGAQVTARLRAIAEADGKFKVNSTRGCKSVTTIVKIGDETEGPPTPKSVNGEGKKKGKRGSKAVEAEEEKSVKKAKKFKKDVEGDEEEADAVAVDEPEEDNGAKDEVEDDEKET